MSRNVRNKSNMTPPKKSVRRHATPADESSDDDYGGVDLISESDEDEPDVEAAEEQAIINTDDEELQGTPRPIPDDEWEGFVMDDALDDDLTFFEEHMPYSGNTEATLFPSSDAEMDTRRVHFDLSDSSSTMSNDEDEFDSEYPFPEFVDQSKLDPGFRRQIEDDRDEDRASSDGSFWDFGSAVENPLQQDEVDGNTSDSSSGSESGYDTDSEGEATEDEDLPARRFVPGRSILRQPSIESDSEAETIDRRRPQTPDHNLPGPRLGTFEQKPTRPFAVVDLKTKRLLMFKAKVKRRFSFNDVPMLPGVYGQGNDTFPVISPMISNTGNMMMNAMYPMGLGEVLGPPEAFYPFTDIFPNGTITQDSPSSFDEDDMEDIKDFFEDFVDFSADGDERVTEAEEQDESGSTDGDMFSTSRPTTAVSSEDQALPFLSNPRLVGAFRTNQDTHRLLSGSNMTADSMRFASRFHDTAIQGIKNGHISAAATPITPLRKQKPRPDASSPLAQKRKFDHGEDRGHKRSKSMN